MPPRFTCLADWLEWQASLHPTAIDLGLSRVCAVLERMPQRADDRPCVITIAGTNGKGSVAAMLAEIYQTAGYSVGCFTSPHLLRYNERIRINGDCATDQHIMHAFQVIDAARQTTSLTDFEFDALAAWFCFLHAQVDIAILEVGLGGRLDAVNAIEPDVAVVTSISIDHVDWLGDTREDIGREKAGIFRAHRPAICGDAQAPASVAQTARQLQAEYLPIQQAFGFQRKADGWDWWSASQRLERLPAPGLLGDEQYNNAAVALQVLDCLRAQRPVLEADIRRGLAAVRLAGRFQVLRRGFPIILDVAHNPDAATRLAEKLNAHKCAGRTFAIVGVMQDKDVDGVLSPLLPLVDHWRTVLLNVPRAIEPQALAAVIEKRTAHPVHADSGMRVAIAKISVDATALDRLVIFGSFVAIAQGLEALDISI